MLKKIFLLFFFYNAIQIYQYVSDKYSYQYEDWLINYSNGFVRRGFVGELLFKFSEILNINIQYIVFVLLILVIGIFYLKSYQLLSKIKLNLVYYFLIFSSLFYFFYLNNHSAGIRKEFLLFIFFTYLVLKISLNKNHNYLWSFSVIFPFLILIHEGLIFYLIFYIFFILLILNNKNYKSFSYQFIFLLIFSSIFTILSIKFNGSTEHVLQICQSLKNQVKDSCTSSGAIYHLKDGLVYSINHVLREHDLKSLTQWSLIAFYCYLPLIYIIRKAKFKKNLFIEKKLNISSKKLFILLILLSFVSILPLFVVAFDWGRWLSIHFHLLSLILIFLVKNKIIFFSKKSIFNSLKIKKNLNKKIIFCLIIFATFVTPTVFDKKSSDHLNPYKFNYIEIIKKGL